MCGACSGDCLILHPGCEKPAGLRAGWWLASPPVICRLAVALGLLLLLAPTARANTTFKVTVTPQVATYPETRELTYRVVMTTTDAAKVSVVAFGNGLVTPSAYWLEGAGRLGPALSTHGDPGSTFCGGSGLGFREFHHPIHYGYTFPIELPENSVSTLVVKGRLSPDAPQPGEDYRLYLGVPGGAPVVPAMGPKGVPIKITMDSPCTPERAAGEPITITGTTDPALAGENMTLMVRRYETDFYTGSPRTTEGGLAQVRVADDGSFALRDWRPEKIGKYAVQAQYKTTRPDIANDFSNPLAFTLKPNSALPVPAPPTHATPVPRKFVLTHGAATTKAKTYIRSQRKGRNVKAACTRQSEAQFRCRVSYLTPSGKRRRGLLNVGREQGEGRYFVKTGASPARR